MLTPVTGQSATLIRSPFQLPGVPEAAAVQPPDIFTPGSDAAAAEPPSKSLAARIGLAGALLIPIIGGGYVAVNSLPPLPISMTVARRDVVTQDAVSVLADSRAEVDGAVQSIHDAQQSVRLETSKLDGPNGEAVARAVVDRAPHLKTAQVLVEHTSPTTDFLQSHGVEVRTGSHLPPGTVLITDLNTVQLGAVPFSGDLATDTGLRIEGPAAESFHAQWQAAWGTPDHETPLPLSSPQADNARLKVLDGPSSRTRMLDLIRHAKRSIRMEMHDLGDQQTIQALRDAQNRGVAVNVLLDAGHGNLGAALAFSNTTEPLPMRWATTPLGTRMAIFDESDVVLGSTDFGGNTAGIDVEMDSPQLADQLNFKFFGDWQDHGTYQPVVPTRPWSQEASAPQR